jgi:RNA 2',3'-cyclic 3'-phosphodiesterase
MSNREGREGAGAEKQRLFVAIELPSAWLEAFRQFTDAMRELLASSSETSDARVRWVRPEGIHLTLKFLGEVPATRRPAIETAIAEAVPTMPQLRLEAAKVGWFARRGVPQVIWVGVGGQLQELSRLAGHIDDGLSKAGFARERREFAPHLTLGRFHDDTPAVLRQRVVELATQLELTETEPFEVEAVVLVRSHLGRSGATYEIVGRWP